MVQGREACMPTHVQLAVAAKYTKSMDKKDRKALVVKFSSSP